MEQNYFRDLIVGVNTPVPLMNGEFVPSINFDNAATTPPFHSVLQQINQFSVWYSSIHRGTGYKSQLSSNFYESSRNTILKFVKGNLTSDTVIYVKNTTEAINKLANRLSNDQQDVVLSTYMEHHSNDLPWRKKFKVDYVETNPFGQLDMEDLKRKLVQYKGKVNLVAVSGASNVTGIINPIHEIAKVAHQYHAKILVDGAQLVPHSRVKMETEDPLEKIDFLAFSAHKMYAPFGTGVLIGPRDFFVNGDPDYVGGGTVKIVTHDVVYWDDPPHKEEAGTPNLMGIMALVTAINTIKEVGIEHIDHYENGLLQYAIEQLKQVPAIELYSDFENKKPHVGIISFNIQGLHHSVVAKILSYEAGIAVRNGCFCAQPYIFKLLNVTPEELKDILSSPDKRKPGMVRASFGLYNTYEEIDHFIQAIKHIIRYKDFYMTRYSAEKCPHCP